MKVINWILHLSIVNTLIEMLNRPFGKAKRIGLQTGNFYFINFSGLTAADSEPHSNARKCSKRVIVVLYDYLRRMIQTLHVLHIQLGWETCAGNRVIQMTTKC